MSETITWSDPCDTVTTTAGVVVVEAGCATPSAVPGSPSEVIFNNAGTLDGAENVQILSQNLQLITPATAPTTASANGLVLYSENVAGKDCLFSIEDTGWANRYQLCIGHNKAHLWNFPGGGTTANPPAWGMPNATTQGNQQTRVFSTTNALTASTRNSFTQAVINTARQYVGYRTATSGNFCWRGDAATRGGFLATIRFGIGDAVLAADGYCFMGLINSPFIPTNGTTYSPLTALNVVGLCQIEGSGNTWYWCHNDGAGTATAVSTGVTIDTSSIYTLNIFAGPNGSSIGMRLDTTTFSGTTSVSYTTSTDIPTTTSTLGFGTWRAAADSLNEVAIDYLSMYAETPH